MNIYEQRDELLQETRDSAALITKLRAEWQADISAAAAEAVQAEREAIKENIIQPAAYSLQYGGDRNQADLRDIAGEMLAAIRARSNGAGK